jgi:hypothetical protein
MSDVENVISKPYRRVIITVVGMLGLGLTSVSLAAKGSERLREKEALLHQPVFQNNSNIENAGKFGASAPRSLTKAEAVAREKANASNTLVAETPPANDPSRIIPGGAARRPNSAAPGPQAETTPFIDNTGLPTPVAAAKTSQNRWWWLLIIPAVGLVWILRRKK